MMLTEAQARKAWCPETYSDRERQASCLANGCMAWRWGDGEWKVYAKPDGELFWATTNKAVAEAKDNNYTPVGYCGKAGRP